MRYELIGKLDFFGPEVNSQIVNVSRGQEVPCGRHGNANRRSGHQEAVHQASGGQVPGANGAIHPSRGQPAAVGAERLVEEDKKHVDGLEQLDGQWYIAIQWRWHHDFFPLAKKNHIKFKKHFFFPKAHS